MKLFTLLKNDFHSLEKKCAAHYLEDAYLMTVNNKTSNQQDTKRKFIQNDITFKTSHMTPQKEEKDEIVYLFRQKLFCDIIFQAVSPIFRYRENRKYSETIFFRIHSISHFPFFSFHLAETHEKRDPK